MELIEKPIKKPDITCKLVIIGDTAVGKSCLMRRFTDDEFSANFISTIGIDYKAKIVEIRGKIVKVVIWDTAGLERYRSLTPSYYRDTKGIIIAYDITNKRSFENCVNWAAVFDTYACGDIERMLVGNKCDREIQRSVPREEGEMMAKKYRMYFQETSAKENINVNDLFMTMVTNSVNKEIEKLEMKQKKKENVENSNVHLTKKNSCRKAKGKCCK